MRKRYIFLGCLSAFAALISQLPLSWVAPHFLPAGVGQNIGYSGTVWNGQVKGLDYIGTANFQVNPKALVSGGLPLTFVSQSPKLPTRDGRLKELAGNVNIQLSELQMKEGSCAFAKGKASTDFLSLNRSRWRWQGPILEGPISCEEGDLVVNLAGRENRQIIRADLRLSQNGSYGANITVQTDQAEAGVVLPLYGFEKQGRQYKLTEQGQWR